MSQPAKSSASKIVVGGVGVLAGVALALTGPASADRPIVNPTVPAECQPPSDEASTPTCIATRVTVLERHTQRLEHRVTRQQHRIHHLQRRIHRLRHHMARRLGRG